MSYLQANPTLDRRPAVTSTQFGDLKVVSFEYALTAALALNDIIGLAKLPVGHMPVDCLINVPDLDSNGAPAIVLDAGFWKNDASQTVVDADAVVDGSTAGQAGGLITPNVGTFLTMTPPDEEYIFGLLTQVAPATGATSGTISGWFSFRPVTSDD